MNSFVTINGIIFKKSSFSDRGRHCVGVSIQNSHVLVINTKTSGPTVEFTFEEWESFIKGVKTGQFDIERKE